MKVENREKFIHFIDNVYSDLTVNEKIRLMEFNEEGTPIQRFCNTKQELVEFVERSIKTKSNYYLQLATIQKQAFNGKTESLLNRSCLVFDFDKKDYEEGFNHLDIIDRYSKNNIDYHCIIDSGNGYHVYTFIEKTDNIELVDKVQSKLCELLGADRNAIKKTQIMRIPYTFNAKDIENLKHVNIFHIYDNIRKKDITYYEKVFLNTGTETDDTENKLYNRTTIKPCINNLLENGTEKGNRNNSLLRLIPYFRDNKGYTLEQVEQIIKEYNNKCVPPLTDSELNYQIPYIYKEQNHAIYNCDKCSVLLKNKCIQFNGLNDYNQKLKEENEVIKLVEKDMRFLEKRPRRASFENSSIVVYQLLLHLKGKPLSLKEIEKELTYKDKTLISKKTLLKRLQNLLELELIRETEGKSIKGQNIKLYEVTSKQVKDKDEIYYICSSALYMAIRRDISLFEYKVYNYMKYAKNKNDREKEVKKVSGNVYIIGIEEIARALGTDKKNVSVAIDNLVEQKLLSRFKEKSDLKTKNLFYYVYKFNF